jgi:CHAD domain-containing protein
MLDLAKHVRQFQPPAPRQVVKLLKRNESHVDTHGWDMMLNGFVGRRLHEAFTHLHQPVSKGWHTARMLIKACYFLMKDVNEISPLLFNAQLVALYSVLEQKLGDWHDLDMLYHYLVKHQCAVSAIDNKYQPAMTKVVEAIQYQARLLEEQSETGQ